MPHSYKPRRLKERQILVQAYITLHSGGIQKVFQESHSGFNIVSLYINSFSMYGVYTWGEQCRSSHKKVLSQHSTHVSERSRVLFIIEQFPKIKKKVDEETKCKFLQK